MDNMEQLIDGEIDEIKVSTSKIIRENWTKNLFTKEEQKTLDFNFDKRIMTDTFDT